MHLLLIEDNLDLAANVGKFLESRGYTVDRAGDEVRGLQLAGRVNYHAIILDLGSSPEVDGLTLCGRLRETSQPYMPIVMLTARHTEGDKLRAFEAGVDDYMTKPFSFLELEARLKALQRRTSEWRNVLAVSDLTLDLRTLIVQRGQRTINLAPIGMRILEQLMRASPAVVTRRELEQTVWGDDPPESDASLRGHIVIIRDALETAEEARILHTVHGVGYRLG